MKEGDLRTSINYKSQSTNFTVFFGLGQNLETLTLVYPSLAVTEEIYSFGGNREFAPLKLK